MKKPKPRKKPRRVVLGVGHLWCSVGLRQLVLKKRDRCDADSIMLHVSDLGTYNRIRLVAEVLK